jgi:hypothetical protein
MLEEINNIKDIEKLKAYYRADLKYIDWFKRYEHYIHKAYTIIDAEASAYADGDKEYKENFNN